MTKIELSKWKEERSKIKETNLEQKNVNKPTKAVAKMVAEKKAKKDFSSAPRMYPLPISLYMKEQLSDVQAVQVSEKLRIVSEKWRSMSEAEKEPFIKRHNELKEKYEQDLARWEAS